MTLRAAKWTATLTRATQTLRICLDTTPTYEVAGSAAVDALACARVRRTRARGMVGLRVRVLVPVRDSVEALILRSTMGGDEPQLIYYYYL